MIRDSLRAGVTVWHVSSFVLAITKITDAVAV